MKRTLLVLLMFTAAFSFMALEPGGAAKKGLGNRTGSPLANGTCGSSGCHSGGSFSPVTTIQVLNSANQPVTNYHSDSSYTVKVNVTGTGSKQYAFQIIAMDANNANAGTFSNIPTNTQIVQVGTRFVVEQKAPFDNGSWSFSWKAPNSSLPVTFYACGLATNKNGKESGDQAATTSLKLEKTTSVSETTSDKLDFSIMNISDDHLNLQLTGAVPGSYNCSISSIDGSVTHNEKIVTQTSNGVNAVNISSLPQGIFFVTVSRGSQVLTKKFFKK